MQKSYFKELDIIFNYISKCIAYGNSGDAVPSPFFFFFFLGSALVK